MAGAFTRFILCGWQHTSLPYVIPLCYSYPWIHSLLMRILFLPRSELRMRLFGAVPDFRLLTNIRVSPTMGQQKATKSVNGHIITGRPLNPLFSPSIHHPPPSPAIMGMQKEPGQKGVNWSNIAVGAYASFMLPDPARPIHATGAIMNMVLSVRFYL